MTRPQEGVPGDRHPAVLANMAATYDVFSNGRLDLGIGAGWNELEAKAYGIPFGTMGSRLDQLEEAIQVIRLLFRERCAKVDVLRGHCADVGRDFAEITCSTHVIAGAEPNETADNAAAFVARGAGHLCLYFFDLSNRELLGKTVEAVSGALGR